MFFSPTRGAKLPRARCVAHASCRVAFPASGDSETDSYKESASTPFAQLSVFGSGKRQRWESSHASALALAALTKIFVE